MSSDEVEDFIAGHGIDEHAATALRDLNPTMQASVIDRGGLGNARNPSSVLLSRIRDVQQGITVAEHPSFPGAGRVEDFLRQNPVDDQAATMLRNCGSEVQEYVMQKGISTARNPSSALMARIRDGEKEVGFGSSRKSSHARPQFLAFRSGPPSACGLDGPSSRGEFCTVQTGLLSELEQFIRQHARGNNSDWAMSLLDQISNAKGTALGHGIHSLGGDPRGPGLRDQRPLTMPKPRFDSPRLPPPPCDSFHEKVEAFLRANPVDAKAADALRQCEPRVAQAVMDKGINTARNPSSALLARIRDERPREEAGGYYAHEPHHEPHRKRRGRLEEEVDAFIRSTGVDGRAADALLQCSPDVQKAVIDRGVSGARNPSSALLARIRDFQPQPGASPRGDSRYAPY